MCSKRGCPGNDICNMCSKRGCPTLIRMRRLAYKARALASHPHIKFIKLRMKSLVVLGLILFASQLSYAVDNGDDTPASIEPGVTQTVASYEKFMGATYNGKLAVAYLS